MTQPARTKLWQRIIDGIIGAVITVAGDGEFVRFLQQPLHHEIAGLIWAFLYAVSGAAIIVGAITRTIRPGWRQDVGFGFELLGWGFSAFLTYFYAVIGFSHDHNWVLLVVLIGWGTALLGSWLRLTDAMRDVSKGRTG